MVKFVFVLVLALLVCTVAAYRVERDAPQPEEAQKVLENALDQIQAFMKKTFSQDEFQKFGDNIKDISEKLSAKGKELLDEASASMQKMKN